MASSDTVIDEPPAVANNTEAAAVDAGLDDIVDDEDDAFAASFII